MDDPASAQSGTLQGAHPPELSARRGTIPARSRRLGGCWVWRGALTPWGRVLARGRLRLPTAAFPRSLGCALILVLLRPAFLLLGLSVKERQAFREDVCSSYLPVRANRRMSGQTSRWMGGQPSCSATRLSSSRTADRTASARSGTESGMGIRRIAKPTARYRLLAAWWSEIGRAHV